MKNVTKGEWSFEDCNGCKEIYADSVEYSIATAFTHGVPDDEEDLANAELICDAANVFHATGYTPSKLKQQKDELLEASAELLRFKSAMKYTSDALASPQNFIKAIDRIEEILTKYSNNV